MRGRGQRGPSSLRANGAVHRRDSCNHHHASSRSTAAPWARDMSASNRKVQPSSIPWCPASKMSRSTIRRAGGRDGNTVAVMLEPIQGEGARHHLRRTRPIPRALRPSAVSSSSSTRCRRAWAVPDNGGPTSTPGRPRRDDRGQGAGRRGSHRRHPRGPHADVFEPGDHGSTFGGGPLVPRRRPPSSKPSCGGADRARRTGGRPPPCVGPARRRRAGRWPRSGAGSDARCRPHPAGVLGSCRRAALGAGLLVNATGARRYA